jgi:anti-sigma factor RsiW
MSKKAMKCKQARRFLDRFVDGELADELASRVGQHASSCPDCGGYVESTRSISQAIKTAGMAVRSQASLSEQEWGRLKEALTKKKRIFAENPFMNLWRWLTFYPRPVWVSAFAAAALIVALTTINMLHYGEASLSHPVVEYVESESSQVMVIMPEQSPVTVIWLFENAKATGG